MVRNALAKIKNINSDECEICHKDIHQRDSTKDFSTKHFLQIHHKDKNKKNNQPENLQILCSVCHGKTKIKKKDYKEQDILPTGKIKSRFELTKIIFELFSKLSEEKKKEVLSWDFDLGKRGWMVYLACLQEAKTIKQMTKEFGYTKKSSVSALYHDYHGVPLIDWMLNKGILKIERKEGRNLFYRSV